MEATSPVAERFATLTFAHTDMVPTLTARVPLEISREEFGNVVANAYDLVSKLTGHPCMSGRIKFVVEDLFLNDLTRVDLKSGRMF